MDDNVGEAIYDAWVDARALSGGYPVTTPQGAQEKLFRQVAVEASERYGRDVTPRMVERCVKAYRRLVKRLRRDLDSAKT